MDGGLSQLSHDLDLALVRSFTVVAEHQHFGRAAQALHVAQPALSRQIRRLETQVGARLFDRDTRGTRLTAAGEAFLAPARELLAAARAASAAARAADAPDQITVGYLSALVITSAVQAFRATRPEVTVHTRHLAWNEPHRALVEHRVDVALARLPFPTEGLRVQHLHTEPRVLLVALGHHLAERRSVRVADFADEPVPRLPDPDPEYAAFWRVDPRPDGSPAPLGPIVAGPEDRLEAVAAGGAVAVATAALQDGYLRSDLVSVPIDDIEPVTVVLASRAGDRSDVIEEFLRVAALTLS